jgi:hypothetical protein
MKVRIALTIATVAFVACSANEYRGMTVSKTDPKAVIKQYVAAHKGWPTADFRIEEHGHQNGNVVYFVIYIPEERATARRQSGPFTAGGGKSFSVYYDATQHKVIKEMGFQ